MPWLRNNELQLSTDLSDVYARINNTVRLELYRSRNPLDGDLFTYITMPFRLPGAPNEKSVIRNKFKTMAMPRGLEPAEALGQVVLTLDRAKVEYRLSRHISIYNTSSNQAITQYVAMNLKENHDWIEHDFRTALTCTPFHTLTVLSRNIGTTEHHVVILTDIINDEFIIKLGAVLPIIYGIDVPAAITQAYLECDKRLFVNAFEVAVAELVALRRHKEQLEQIDQLDVWLRTADTARITRSIDSKQHSISELEARVRSAYTDLQNLLMQEASTYWGAADTRAIEFINYLKEYELDKITKMSLRLEDDSFKVQLLTELSYWDEEVFNNYTTSQRDNCVTRQEPSVQALLKSIFIDKTVKVVFHTAVDLHFKDGYVSKSNDFLRDGDSTLGMPHTHIYHYDCWGNNKSPIEKAFKEKNYLIAWEQIKATLSGLNLVDTTVFDKFCSRYMAGTDTPCLILKDTGERLSPNQFRQRFPQGYTGATPAVVEVEAEATPVERRVRVRRPQPVVEPVVETVDVGDDDDDNNNPF